MLGLSSMWEGCLCMVLFGGGALLAERLERCLGLGDDEVLGREHRERVEVADGFHGDIADVAERLVGRLVARWERDERRVAAAQSAEVSRKRREGLLGFGG